MGSIFRQAFAAELVVTGLFGLAQPALAAGDVTGVRVVVHVVDYASVPANRMTAAQKLVTEVYRGIGVALTFEESHIPMASMPGVLDLQVSFLSAEMTEAKCRLEQLPDAAFGAAVNQARRAYVFYDRVSRLDTKGQSHPVTVLAAVLAHELGHLLLPEGSHSPDGLMRAHWNGPIRSVPQFNRRQAARIRERLEPTTELALR